MNWVLCLAVAITLGCTTSCSTSYTGMKAAVSSRPPNGVVYTQISAGSGGYCALRSDGQAICWGPAGSAFLSPGETFKFVAAGHFCTCAIRVDDTVACWGTDDPEFGFCKAPPGQFVKVALGWRVHCGVRTDGAVHCWGQANFIATVAEGFRDVIVGEGHVCMLTNNGDAACFGTHAPGCMSAPAEKFSNIHMAPQFPYTSAVCGVKLDGTLLCWGYGNYVEDAQPVASDMAVRGRISITTDGNPIELRQRQGFAEAAEDVRSRSVNTAIVLDGGHAINGAAVATTAASASMLAAAYMHATEYTRRRSRVLDNGLAYVPQGTFTQVVVTESNACAIRTNGAIACWGKQRWDIVHPPPWSFTQIAIRFPRSACGLRDDGMIACWGEDFAGLRMVQPP